jgi:hypothetical protein
MLFNRVCSLVIGKSGGSGKELSDLRISFNIQKGSVKTPNKCTCRVYNAAPATRELIGAIGNALILKAGYADDIGVVTIFMGDVTHSTSVKEGPDWITEIEMQDGFQVFRDSKISLSMAAGATTLQVIQSISSKFGLGVRPMPTDVAAKQYKNGFAFVGRCRDAMDKACEYMGLEWSIQNNEVQVIKKGGTLKQRAYVLSPTTGLIGSPMIESQTMTEKAAAKLGYTAKQAGVQETYELNRDGEFESMLRVYGYNVVSLLQPAMEPGGLVQLKTGSIKGEFFRIEELTHNGDTHGQEWHTNLLLRYL